MEVNNTLKIGNITLKNNIICAPMAGISNNAFKSLVHEMGAGLLTTEMVSDKALLYKNEKTLKMIDLDENIHPVCLQLFGSEASTMAKAAKYLEENTCCDIIDINMGCPAPKIVKNSSGSKILLDTNKVYEIAKSVKEAVNIPVTAKIRLGWDDNNINVIDNVKALERAGIDAIFIHGRTTKQMYSGEANWDLIKQAKESISIPVIGNGDIDTPQKALEYKKKYGVDGIMIGRGILGNPWLIKRTVHLFETGELLDEPSILDKLNALNTHLLRLVELKGETIAIKEMRGLAFYYLKGIRGNTKFKKDIQNVNTVAEFNLILDEFKNGIN